MTSRKGLYSQLPSHHTSSALRSHSRSSNAMWGAGRQVVGDLLWDLTDTKHLTYVCVTRVVSFQVATNPTQPHLISVILCQSQVPNLSKSSRSQSATLRSRHYYHHSPTRPLKNLKTGRCSRGWGYLPTPHRGCNSQATTTRKHCTRTTSPSGVIPNRGDQKPQNLGSMDRQFTHHVTVRQELLCGGCDC